jgi:oxalate decarboxylase/phosphoglucose isomerase-like protein (cupin superfamily)
MSLYVNKEMTSTPMTRVALGGQIPRVRNDDDYKHVEKVWGSELWIINTPLYCNKMLIVKKGHHTSMHFHQEKHETMFCAEGSFRIDFIDGNGDLVSRVLNQADSIVIPPTLAHSIHGLGEFNVLFETSTQHFDHDSVRVGKPG